MKKIINVHNASSWFLESLTGRSHKSAPNSCMLSRSNQYLEGCLSWFSKQIVHLLFWVFQTKLNKAVNIFCRLPDWIRNVQMIPGFSTRLGWERGLKSYIANSKDWRSKNLNVIELNCKVVTKVATPSPSQVYPPFLAKYFAPPLPSDPIFGRSYLPLLIRVGGSNYVSAHELKIKDDKTLS